MSGPNYIYLGFNMQAEPQNLQLILTRTTVYMVNLRNINHLFIFMVHLVFCPDPLVYHQYFCLAFVYLEQISSIFHLFTTWRLSLFYLWYFFLVFTPNHTHCFQRLSVILTNFDAVQFFLVHSLGPTQLDRNNDLQTVLNNKNP